MADLTNTSVTFAHDSFRKLDGAGNLRPILIRPMLAIENC
jgi:hypothetical protein